MKLQRLALLCVSACAVAACSGSGGTNDGGTSGGSGPGGNNGGTSGGGSVGPLPDAGPLTATQICLALWAGEQRANQLEALPLAAVLNAQQGTYCPGPNAAQLAQLTQQNNAAAGGVLALLPPDGGWPDGSGPSICDDPTTAFSGTPAEIAASLAAGRVIWNAAAAATCAAGLQQSADFVAFVSGDGGSFPGEAQTVGNLVDGGGPCLQILQGAVADGGSCATPFDCVSGFYCQSTGANASCGGTCQPLVAQYAPCGPLDQCAGTLACLSGFCGGPAPVGPLPTHDAGVGATCVTAADCDPCLVCITQVGGVGSVCATFGLAGATCGSDNACGTPWLYCDTTSGTCTASATFGQTCSPTSQYVCLNGWCNGSTCAPISDIGGPCSTANPSLPSGCPMNLYCKQPVLTQTGVCAPYPAVGQPCGTAQGLSFTCAGDQTYCDTFDAGLCAQLPAVGAPCTSNFECNSSGSCQAADAGVYVCAPLGGVGSSCLTIPCQAGLYCSSAQVCTALLSVGATCKPNNSDCAAGLVCNSANICAAPLPGGAACKEGLECLSDSCVTNVCTSPCVTSGSPLDAGCGNQGLSLLLGLGGALVWFDQRRRRSSSHPS